jgi:hypothetical protein
LSAVAKSRSPDSRRVAAACPDEVYLRHPNCSGLAEALEVSPKTVQRDIDFMRYQLDLPIEYIRCGTDFSSTARSANFPRSISPRLSSWLCWSPRSFGTVCGYTLSKAAAAAFENSPRDSSTKSLLTGRTWKLRLLSVRSALPNVILLRLRLSPRLSESGASWSSITKNWKRRHSSAVGSNHCRWRALRTSGTYGHTIGSGATCGPFTWAGSRTRNC